MRVAIWNMNHWRRSADERSAAWTWLRESAGADIALVQEAVVPDDVGNAVYEPIGGSRPWGSAVVGFTVEVSEITTVSGAASKEPEVLKHSRRGTVAAATAAIGSTNLTLISMYGLIENGYADPNVHRQLSDLAPLLDDPQLGHRLVMGGDLNITTQWTDSNARYRRWEQTTFARISAFGLHDCLDHHRSEGPLDGCECLDGPDCRHVRTQYHERSARPWQNDYAFVTDAVLGATGRAFVVDDETVRALSDHLPLLIDVDVDRLG